MAFGSMAPPLMQMPAPPKLQDTSIGGSSAALLKALSSMSGGLGLGGGAPGAPGAGGAPAGGMPALLGPKGGLTDIMNGGMGNGLLAKLFPPAAPAAPGAPLDLAAAGAGGAIDPATGLPMVAPPAAPAMDMGAGLSPTALTGLW